MCLFAEKLRPLRSAEASRMSIVPKENIEVISQSIGINNLSPDVALALAPDVEYRLREIMQVKLLLLFSLITEMVTYLRV